MPQVLRGAPRGRLIRRGRLIGFGGGTSRTLSKMDDKRSACTHHQELSKNTVNCALGAQGALRLLPREAQALALLVRHLPALLFERAVAPLREQTLREASPSHLTCARRRLYQRPKERSWTLGHTLQYWIGH